MIAHAFRWARKQVLDTLAMRLRVDSRQLIAEGEELCCHIEGRLCRVFLWAKQGQVEVALLKRFLPQGLCINESSAWGHQKQEAWSIGDAVKTGDPEFDAGFIVVGAPPGTRPLPNEVRRISARVRAALMERRSEIRDAEVTSERLIIPIHASGTVRHRSPSFDGKGAHTGAVWAIGTALLGFRSIPSAADLEEGVLRAVRLADALEAAGSVP